MLFKLLKISSVYLCLLFILPGYSLGASISCNAILQESQATIFFEGKALREPLSNLMTQGPVGFYEGSHVITLKAGPGLPVDTQIGAYFVNPRVEVSANLALMGINDSRDVRINKALESESDTNIFVLERMKVMNSEWVLEIYDWEIKEADLPPGHTAEVIQLFPDQN